MHVDSLINLWLVNGNTPVLVNPISFWIKYTLNLTWAIPNLFCKEWNFVLENFLANIWLSNLEMMSVL